MTMPGVLQRIVDSRRRGIEREGFSLGDDVPLERLSSHPLVPLVRRPLVICEVKRQSPSRGRIVEDMEPVSQAALYQKQGIQTLSVLTEREYFAGSLADLMAIKTAFPELALLRKDFLLEEEDIRLSHRAGADGVLLIVAILSPQKLATLYRLSHELGLATLVEVHNAQELQLVRDAGIQPEVMGVNARNLSNFRVDLLSPFVLRSYIDWPCDLVFESGIFAAEQVALAAMNEFTGVLVGEAVMRNPLIAAALGRALNTPLDYPAAGNEFWSKILARKEQSLPRPLVKICGLCHAADALLAAELGADLLGFVFADSPRRANIGLLRELGDLPVLKVAVLTEAPDAELRAAWEQGLIHAFQYHGSEGPQECLARGLPFYKALRVRKKEDLDHIMNYPSPRVLVDAWSDYSSGGTGRELKPELVKAAADQKPLWLAGGLNPKNLARILTGCQPELVDTSSGVESRPGKKDPAKLRAFFEVLAHV